MVVKRRGAERPVVLACTLLAYDPQFELGATLAEASRPVSLKSLGWDDVGPEEFARVMANLDRRIDELGG